MVIYDNTQIDATNQWYIISLDKKQGTHDMAVASQTTLK